MTRTVREPGSDDRTITVAASLSFRVTVVSHGWYRLAPFDWDDESSTLRRVEVFDDGVALDLTIREVDGNLVVRGNRSLRNNAATLETRLRRMFQLDVDLDDFHRRCARLKSHRVVAEQKYGRLLCGSTLFEDIVKIITTTNTNWASTVRMNERLVSQYGRRAATGRRGFPLPRDLAAATEEELRERCRLGYRARTIHHLARGISDGSIRLGEIADPNATTEQLLKKYQSLPGIGPYGAAHLLAMDGRHDFIAVDTEFRRFVRERHFAGREAADEELLARYDRWGKWKYLGYWSEIWNELVPRVETIEKARRES